jgi:hypothetical protein
VDDPPLRLLIAANKQVLNSAVCADTLNYVRDNVGRDGSQVAADYGSKGPRCTADYTM